VKSVEDQTSGFDLISRAPRTNKANEESRFIEVKGLSRSYFAKRERVQRGETVAQKLLAVRRIQLRVNARSTCH
jgi:hypothetical protein